MGTNCSSKKYSKWLSQICQKYLAPSLPPSLPYLRRWTEAVAQRCFCKKGILRNFAKFTGKHLCQSLFFIKVPGLRPTTLLKKTLTRLFSSEFCEICKNTFSYRTPSVAASGWIFIVIFWNSLTACNMIWELLLCLEDRTIV